MKKFALGVKKSPFPSFFLVKNSALHSVRGCYFQKSVLGIIESFTKTVVKRKFFQTNHSEMVAFSKKLSLVLCGQLFYRSSKKLATLPVIIVPLSREATKNSIGKQHKN